MREVCSCGRCGEIEDREPVLLRTGERTLACPGCGDLDRLDWLLIEVRKDVFEEAENTRGACPRWYRQHDSSMKITRREVAR